MVAFRSLGSDTLMRHHILLLIAPCGDTLIVQKMGGHRHRYAGCVQRKVTTDRRPRYVYDSRAYL